MLTFVTRHKVVTAKSTVPMTSIGKLDLVKLKWDQGS